MIADQVSVTGDVGVAGAVALSEPHADPATAIAATAPSNQVRAFMCV
jgi:hypothetical protein